MGARQTAVACRAHLLLKVPDGKVVGVGEEVRDAAPLHALLHVIHEPGAVPLSSPRARRGGHGSGAPPHRFHPAHGGTAQRPPADLDLLGGGDGAKGDLGEPLLKVGPEANAADHLALLDGRHRAVAPARAGSAPGRGRPGADLAGTHLSRTRRTMYSRGILGSWFEKMVFRLMSQTRCWGSLSLRISRNVSVPAFSSRSTTSSLDKYSGTCTRIDHCETRILDGEIRRSSAPGRGVAAVSSLTSAPSCCEPSDAPRASFSALSPSETSIGCVIRPMGAQPGPAGRWGSPGGRGPSHAAATKPHLHETAPTPPPLA